MRLRRRVVKFDPVGRPVMACIHGAIVATKVGATVFGDVRKIDWRCYRGQKCHSMGKLLHFPSWNVSWLNS